MGIAVASTPKARHQMDGETLEINRCCTDPRYPAGEKTRWVLYVS